MKIVIPGGSGQVGTVLGRAFQREGHEIVVISRQPVVRPWRVVSWGRPCTSFGLLMPTCQEMHHMYNMMLLCQGPHYSLKTMR
jgi:short subunit dehydrogenase-like uncharacterized protein